MSTTRKVHKKRDTLLAYLFFVAPPVGLERTVQTSDVVLVRFGYEQFTELFALRVAPFVRFCLRKILRRLVGSDIIM